MRNYFGETLRSSLKRRYGKLPSAAVVAREFNLRCNDCPAVCNETVRRWIRGVSIPDATRLATISHWLNIDYNSFFSRPQRAPFALIAEEREAVHPAEDRFTPSLDHALCARIRQLDEAGQKLLLKLLNAYGSVFQQNNLTDPPEQNQVGSLSCY